MSNRTIEAVVRLSAKLGPMAAFGQMGAKMADVNKKAAAFNKTQALVARSSNAATAAMMRFAAPAAIAYGAQRAVREFAGVERTLTRIGINADASREQMAGVFKELQQIAQATATPVDNIVSGLDSLIASGKSLDEAMALIGSVSATAQAAGADFGQMATTADAVSNSFGIAGDSMQGAFDILAMGGKAGKFELRDMAAELPSLAPAFAALGYEGEDGLKRLTAALQTVRMETGTSGEAATSFMDVLTKMNSVTVSNSFKKQFGVDLRNEMKKAKAAGEDTLEAFIRLSKEAIDGDMSKLPLLFTDKQMLIGMRALMNHTGDYTELLKALGNAAGTVYGDVNRVLKDSQSSIDRMANSWDRLKTSFGETIAPTASTAMETISSSLDRSSAINAALEKTGTAKGWWARSHWGITSSEAEKDSMAWVGGYRTDQQRALIAQHKDYRDAASAAPSVPVTRTPEEMAAMRAEVWGSVPQNVVAPMPAHVRGTIPIPQARPDPTDAAIDTQDAVRAAALRPSPKTYAPFASGTSPRDAERASMHALRSDPNGVAVAIDDATTERFKRALEGSGADLAKGGEDAANAVSASGDDIARGGQDAAAALRAAGAAIAAQIKSAVANVNVRNSTGTPSAAAVSGNPGRTMPGAGKAGGGW